MDTLSPIGAAVPGPLAGAPFVDFVEAGQSVLRLLREQWGMHLWLLTRAVGDDQVVLGVEDAEGHYGVVPGQVLDWANSLCVQMVAGNGPTVAPRVEEVPAYAAALNRRIVPVQAYMGVPLRQADGRLFGTLCAFDAAPQSDVLLGAQPQLRLKARLLATVLELELAQQELRRRAERAELIAAQDALTGLANRRGWDQILAAEESRCQRYGHPACVLVVDINNLKAINDTQGHAAGDRVLRECAHVLADTVRESDLVARLGGDEFGVLAVETTFAGGAATREQLCSALTDAGISVAIGIAPRASSLNHAWQEADKAMYVAKLSQRA